MTDSIKNYGSAQEERYPGQCCDNTASTYPTGDPQIELSGSRQESRRRKKVLSKPDYFIIFRLEAYSYAGN
jgi:hypothetical protein